MRTQERYEEEIRKAKAVIEEDLAWHKWIEEKLVHAGINKKDICTFVNAAIDEKIAKYANDKGD